MENLNTVQSYWPEMGETRPTAQGEVSYAGNSIFVDSSVELKTSRSVKLLGRTNGAHLLNPRKAGWYEYRVTDAGLKEVRKQITLCREALLD